MILISDNIHVMNPEVAKAMNDMDTKPIRDLASRIKNSGANIIANLSSERGYRQRANDMMVNIFSRGNSRILIDKEQLSIYCHLDVL